MVNEDLVSILQWCQQNMLVVNQAKSKALFVKGGRRNAAPTSSLPSIQLDDLQWDELINQQCGKIYAGLRTLYSSTRAAPVETRLKLFKALLLPHFLFGDLLYVSPSAGAMDRLRVALNSCVRFVYGLNRYSRVSHLQKNLVGCPLDRLFAHRSCLFIWKLITTRSPPLLYQKLVPFRGRRQQNLILPRNNTLAYASSLFVRGAVNWNMLPADLKRTTSEATFKRGCLAFWNQVQL
ncbi:uncharacterized protein LOC119766099 [Culex quinquefasciatus]|uniref:uncharacterized protein LOC119766099 n=1 Tax=Culex quinquefasciatus TaxID=7176 RepID=UPI0018E2EEDC|nr:uncharacterized protein LOC119766099 [Culex quinquefasciatus]